MGSVLFLFFFPEKEHRLATIPSLFSMYFRGNSLCAQIMMPVWHAESSSVTSGSFRVKDRDWGTLETQGSCSGVRQLVDSGLLENRPWRRVEPGELLFICFSLSIWEVPSPVLTGSACDYGASGPDVGQQQQNLLYDLYSITCLRYLRPDLLIPLLHQGFGLLLFENICCSHSTIKQQIWFM